MLYMVGYFDVICVTFEGGKKKRRQALATVHVPHPSEALVVAGRMVTTLFLNLE